MQLVVYFPMPIILSLFLNEVRHSGYKKSDSDAGVCAALYLPWVIIASLTYQLFNVTDGAISMLVKTLTGNSINVLANSLSLWGLD